MSEDLELTGGASGIDRRDFIRKSALVGGMVWAAPMVSSIGSPAFAFTEPGNGESVPLDCEDASFIAVVFKSKGLDPEVTYQAKWEYDRYVAFKDANPLASEADALCAGWDPDPGEAPSCEPAGWNDEGNVKVNGCTMGLSMVVTATEWILTIPDIYQCMDASVKKGAPESPKFICAEVGTEDGDIHKKPTEGGCIYTWDKVDCKPVS